MCLAGICSMDRRCQDTSLLGFQYFRSFFLPQLALFLINATSILFSLFALDYGIRYLRLILSLLKLVERIMERLVERL